MQNISIKEIKEDGMSELEILEEAMTEVKRKGARSIKEIPKEILEQLNHGEIETANLVEFLGIEEEYK